MWTHTVITVEFAGVVVRAIVEFSDNAPSPTLLRVEYKTGQASADWLKREITRTLRDLDANSAFLASVTPGPIDLTPTPVEPPTAEQVAQREALADKARLSVMQQEIALGIRKPDNAEYVALVAKLTKAVDDGVLDAVAVVFP